MNELDANLEGSKTHLEKGKSRKINSLYYGKRNRIMNKET